MPVVALAMAAAHLWLGLTTTAHAQVYGGCSTCTFEERLSHLGEVIYDDPTRGRLESRLENRPWIGQDWAALPIAAKPVDQNFDVAASLQHLGSYEAKRTEQKLEEAKELGATGLVLPKPAPVTSAPLDVWSKVEVTGLDSVDGEAHRGTVGADYKIAGNALLGISAAVRDGTTTLASDTRLAAYFAVKPWSPVTLDANAQWGESHAITNPSLVTTQSAVSARLKGNFSFEGLQLAPALTLAHGVDEMDVLTGRPVEKSTIALTPRVSRPINLKGGAKIEPFISLKSALDFGTTDDSLGHEGVDRTRGVGGGVTFAKPNAYSLSLSTDLERATSSEQPNLSGRVELKVPLR